jgi:hypothetical protein
MSLRLLVRLVLKLLGFLIRLRQQFRWLLLLVRRVLGVRLARKGLRVRLRRFLDLRVLLARRG